MEQGVIQESPVFDAKGLPKITKRRVMLIATEDLYAWWMFNPNSAASRQLAYQRLHAWAKEHQIEVVS